MPQTADIVIIGAGSTGSSVAYHLAKKGVKNIVVLEKLGIGSGATGHAAGLIRHHYPDPELVKIARYCSVKLENFQEEMGFGIDYVKNGFCLLLSESQDELKDIIQMQLDEGVDLEVLEPHQLADIHPKGKINPEGISVALFDHDAAYADPYKVAAGYCQRAKELGVRILSGVEVLDLVIEKGKVTKVVTNKGEIATEMVINAAGIGAIEINQMANTPLPLKYMSLQHGVLLPDGDFSPDIPTINDASTENFLFFLRPESGGTVLIGMDQEDPDKVIKPASYYFDPSFDRLGKYLEYLSNRLPFTQNYALQTTFGALDLRTPDWNPGIGYIENGPEGYFVAVGGSGHAFKLSPAFGEVISQMILGEEPIFDFSIFDVNRLTKFTDEDFHGSFFISETS